MTKTKKEEYHSSIQSERLMMRNFGVDNIHPSLSPLLGKNGEWVAEKID